MEKIRKPAQLEQAEHARMVWKITPSPGTEPKDLLDDKYWAHIASRLKPGDHVEAVPEDRHYYVKLFVIAAAKMWAKVVPINEVELIAENDATETAGFSVKWGGRAKWRVLQGKDVISKGHDTPQLAHTWLENHKKEIG